jgi:hypothetical protein
MTAGFPYKILPSDCSLCDVHHHLLPGSGIFIHRQAAGYKQEEIGRFQGKYKLEYEDRG